MIAGVPSPQAGSLADSLNGAIVQLADHCSRRNWAGIDPYDALNSELFQRTALSRTRIGRLLFTQAVKRLPFDVRPLLRVQPAQNPKALALCVSAFAKISQRGRAATNAVIPGLVGELQKLRSHESPYACWGYSFPWQTRTSLISRGSPNLVCTTFVANSMLDAYAAVADARGLELAVSAGEYILNELFWTDGQDAAGFSYPTPGSRRPIHNANFLAAALLCRLYKCTGDTRYVSPALAAARYSAARQRHDGSWPYGEAQTQQWIDNFHTGYNLCALRAIGEDLETNEFEAHVRRGFEFYMSRFFTKDGAAKYFHDRVYPVDIHSVAQSIITLHTLGDLHAGSVSLAWSVYEWAMKRMWDRRGFFYYQVHPAWTNRISYMRWSQAWMLLALATLSDAAT